MNIDWDFSDSDESAVVPSDGRINFFKKKDAIIELSAVIERQKRPMTAREIHDLFKHEFHQDFPHFHFGYDSMGTFLDDIREVVHDGNLPDGTRLYIANPQYKYHLLRDKARGGGAADRANSKGATAVVNRNTNVGAVVAHLVQQIEHKNGGGFGFPSRGKRGMARRITPVENGGEPSRFSGVPKTPHPPSDSPVMPQVQQQLSREQHGVQQRDQEKGLLGQGAQLQGVPRQELNVQPEHLVKQREKPVNAVVGLQQQVVDPTFGGFGVVTANNGGEQRNRKFSGSSFFTLNGNPGPLERSAAEVVSRITVTARENAWGPTDNDQTNTKMGVNRIGEENTVGGRRRGQSQFNAFKADVPPSVATRSYLDDILDLNLSQPATDNNRELMESGNNIVVKEGNPMVDMEVNPGAITKKNISQEVFVPKTNAPMVNSSKVPQTQEKTAGSARDLLLGVNFLKGAKQELPFRSVFDLGAPNVEPPRQAMQQKQQSSSRNTAQNLTSETVTSISYNKKQLQLQQERNIVYSSAAEHHEMSMGAQQTTMKTIVSRSNFSEPALTFEEAVEFLKIAFPAVGKKINVHFVSDAVLSVIEANPRHFGFGADHNGREVVELLKPMEEALAKPEKPLLQEASLEDLTWMLEGKTVASEEEPFDLAHIVYQTADVVMCASATFGVKNCFRVRAISEELKNRKKMERAVNIRIGWIYVAIHGEHLVRVIVVGQRCDDHFVAILVDGAGQVILKAHDDIWEVPAGCGIEDIPTNIYLARHKAKKAFSEKITDLIVCNTVVEMFFHSQTPQDGIRTADWIAFPHKSSWFSGENPIAVDAMNNAIEVRLIGGYFDTELSTPLATMTPYSHRKKTSPNFIKEMEKVAAVVVRSQKDVEERRETATQALGFFEKLMKQFAIPDDEAADAVKLYNDLHAEAFAR